MTSSAPVEFLHDSIAGDASLSMFQKVLLTTDGTVTQLLELYTGLPIRVRKLEQGILRLGPNQSLMTNADDQVLKRTILLCTDAPGESRVLLFAESLFVVERLPPATQRQLLDCDRPIGLLWRDQRLETYREIIAYRREPCGSLAAHFDLTEATPLLSRSYLIYHQHKPLGMITEKFPADSFRN